MRWGEDITLISACKLKAIAQMVPDESGHRRWQIDNVVDVKDILNAVGQEFEGVAHRDIELGREE
ncbi:hypothetical protein [Sporomusa sp. KB1]|jgi:hypothetical protein|uniref:hypothetical protein n=1 Tax=Sporomusa sp. KB1 TaxID=943346 RepID=UPI0011A67DA8|nr:hypothetical protein [Sporomusa sp. KB1]TWH47976.1 hypothetical protein Salpa_4104 [Sporomusa sp. KB1]